MRSAFSGINHAIILCARNALFKIDTALNRNAKVSQLKIAQPEKTLPYVAYMLPQIVLGCVS